MTKTEHDLTQAASEAWGDYLQKKSNRGGLSSYALGWQDAFMTGAAWRKERDNVQPLMVNGASEMNELRDALATLAESVALMLRQQQDLAAMGLRGTDRGVAILKHLQEIGDNVRGVSGAIGDKFGVVLDHIKAGNARIEEAYSVARATASHMNDQDAMLGTLEVQANRIAKDIGEKVEAVQSQLVDIELIAARVEGYVEPQDMTADHLAQFDAEVSAAMSEPMHAEVKAAGVSRDPMASWDAGKAYARAATECYSKKEDASGLGKLWADVPVNLEDVSDETLDDLHRSGQITTARYIEERGDRQARAILGPRKDTDKITIGKPATVRDVLTAIEAAAELANAVGVRLDWRVTVGAI